MIYGYVRVSTEKQRDNFSVELQRKRIIEFANDLKEEYRIYDDVKSGKSLDRPEMQRMLTDIQNDSYPIKRVWVIEFTRLSRSMEDGSHLMSLFQKHNVELYVKDDQIDLTQASTRFSANINFAVAVHERERTIERITSTKRVAKDEGKIVSNIIYGYRQEFSREGDKEWVINQDEAKIIRKVFDLYHDGESTVSIANYLNERGVVTFKGAKFYAKTVRTILRHLQYFGLVTDTKGKIIPSQKYQPILPFTHEEWQLKLTAREPKRSPPKYMVLSPVSGLIRCAYCGGAYFAENKARKVHTRTIFWHDGRIKTENHVRRIIPCEQPIRSFHADELTEIVEHLFFDSLKEPSVMKAYKQKINFVDFDFEKNKEDTMKLVNRNMALIKQKTRIVESIADGTITNQDAKIILDKIEKERNNNIEEQDILNERRKEMQKKIESSESELASSIIDSYVDSEMKEQRKLLNMIFKSCIIKDLTLTITRIDEKVFEFEL